MINAKREFQVRQALTRVSESCAKSRTYLIAFCMLMMYVTLVTVASQLTSIAFQQNENFKAPFLFILFKMVFRTLSFPMWLLVNIITKLCKGKRIVLVDIWRHCEEICGPEGISWRTILFKFTLPAITMLSLQIGYTLGLTYLTTSMTTALYCSAVAFSYGLTLVFFKRPLLLIKSFFVTVAFVGVGLIAYANFTVKVDLTKTITGIIAALFSALFLSLHQISFMRAFPMGDLGQVSFALTGMNILICLIYWPIPLALYLTKTEVYDIGEMPVAVVVGSWICTGISSTPAGYGLVLSSPFFMSVGELLILVFNSVIDVTARCFPMTTVQLVGTILIGISFLLLVVPDAYLSINCWSGDKPPSHEDLSDEDVESQNEAPDTASVVGPESRGASRSSRRRSLFTIADKRSSLYSASALNLAVRRMSQATGQMTNARGQPISYEFYPSSEPSIILSNRRDELPVGLPESRFEMADGARRMSMGLARLSVAAGLCMSQTARRMSRREEETEEESDPKVTPDAERELRNPSRSKSETPSSRRMSNPVENISVNQFKPSRRMSVWP